MDKQMEGKEQPGSTVQDVKPDEVATKQIIKTVNPIFRIQTEKKVESKPISTKLQALKAKDSQPAIKIDKSKFIF